MTGVFKSILKMSQGYFLATIINQALPFLLLPVLTRYLSVAEYGVLSLYSFYHLISTVLVGAPVVTMVSRYFYDSTPQKSALLIGNCIWLSLSFTFVLETLVLLFYFLGYDFSGIPFFWVLLIPLGAFANVVFSIGLSVCRLKSKVLDFSLGQISNTLINFIISLVFVCLFYWGWIGRALGFMLSYFLSATFTLLYLKKTGFLDFSYSNILQKKIFRFVVSLIPNTLQMIIISQAGLFFMQMFYSKELCGLYSLGFQIAICVKLGVDTLMMSWEPLLFKLLSEGEQLNKRNILRLIWGLIGLLLVGCIITLALTKPVLLLMSTPPYYGASEFVPWFVIGLFFYGIHRFIVPIIIRFDYRTYLVRSSLISMVIMLLLNVCLPCFCGYMGITYAYCMSYFALCLLLVLKVRKILDIQICDLAALVLKK